MCNWIYKAYECVFMLYVYIVLFEKIVFWKKKFLFKFDSLVKVKINVILIEELKCIHKRKYCPFYCYVWN